MFPLEVGEFKAFLGMHVHIGLKYLDMKSYYMGGMLYCNVIANVMSCAILK